MSDIDRAELLRLLDEATPRPWEAEGAQVWGPDGALVAAVPKHRTIVDRPDALIIAAAVNALPDLLEALEEAEGHWDSLDATLIEVQREKLAVEATRDRCGHAHKACHEQRDAAWAAIERVRALHGLCHTCDPAHAPHCDCCDEDWPCLTIQALDGGE